MPKIRYKQSVGALGIASNGTTAVTLFTFGTGLKSPDNATGPGGIIDAIRVFNSDTVAHSTELHAVPSGGAVGNDTMLEKITLGPGEAYRYIGGDRMPDSATVRIKLGEAHTSTPVYGKVEASEVY